MVQARNTLPGEYLKFIDLFNQEEYEKSHEALLAAWLENMKNDFYKGLIQLAGAFQHWNDGNAFWAEDLFASAHNLLEKYSPTCQGLDIEKLLRQIQACNEIARRAKEAGDSGLQDLSMPPLQLILTESQ